MPILKRVEIDAVAKALVNRIVADMIFEFPALRTAIDKVAKRGTAWSEFLDDKEKETCEILLNHFGSSD